MHNYTLCLEHMAWSKMGLGYQLLKRHSPLKKSTSQLESQVRLGNARGQNIAHKLAQYNLASQCFRIRQTASDDSYNLYLKCVLLVCIPFSPSTP